MRSEGGGGCSRFEITIIMSCTGIRLDVTARDEVLRAWKKKKGPSASVCGVFRFELLVALLLKISVYHRHSRCAPPRVRRQQVADGSGVCRFLAYTKVM